MFFALPFAFAFSFALSFALGRDSNWVWEVDVVIKERELGGPGGCGYVILPEGEIVHSKRKRAWSPKGLAQAADRREEGGHSEMVVGIDRKGICC